MTIGKVGRLFGDLTPFLEFFFGDFFIAKPELLSTSIGWILDLLCLVVLVSWNWKTMNILFGDATKVNLLEFDKPLSRYRLECY